MSAADLGNAGGDARDIAGIVTRRQVLKRLSAFSLGGIWGLYATTGVSAPFPQRIVSLDHTLTQIVLTLGVVPIAAAAPQGYRDFVVEPELPDGVLAPGQPPGEPNLELLRMLKPDLILANGSIGASAGPALTRIAPVWSDWDHYLSPDDPFADAQAYHLRLASLLGRERACRSYFEGLDVLFAEMSAVIRQRGRRPMLVMSVTDRRHASVYINNSIFHAALDRLGIVNVYPGESGVFGSAYLGLEQIASIDSIDDADFLIIDRLNRVSGWLTDSPLWKTLRPVRDGRVAILPPIWTTGTLPSLERFVRLLPGAYESMDRSNG